VKERGATPPVTTGDDPMYGFTHADVVEETSLYKLWRRADVA